MADQTYSGELVTIVRQGGNFVLITSYDRKPVTYVKYGCTPILVDR